jgi:hypothetical protein
MPATLFISNFPIALTSYWIQNQHKGFPAFQQIDNTFHCKELPIALWYQVRRERKILTRVKVMLGFLSRKSLTLRRTVLELEEASGATLKFHSGRIGHGALLPQEARDITPMSFGTYSVDAF